MYLRLIALTLLVSMISAASVSAEGEKVFRSRSGGSAAAAFRKINQEEAPQVRARLAETEEEIDEAQPTEIETPKFHTRSGGSQAAQTFRATK